MSKKMRDLLTDARKGGLSQKAVSVLVENLNALTEVGAQGTSVDELVGDEVTLFCVILDETGSMQPHQSDVVFAYSQMLSALKESKTADSILVSTWLFNTKTRLLHSYLPLETTPNLSGYNPNYETALFDATLQALASVVAYGQDLRNSGIRTKIVVVVFTDGEDNASSASVDKVKVLAESLLDQEIYTLAMVAFGGGFAHQVASQMGFPNVLEVNADPSSIRRALGTVSKSVIRVSQTKIDASKGGFFS